jgi:hypothetical protein
MCSGIWYAGDVTLRSPSVTRADPAPDPDQDQDALPRIVNLTDWTPYPAGTIIGPSPERTIPTPRPETTTLCICFLFGFLFFGGGLFPPSMGLIAVRYFLI